MYGVVFMSSNATQMNPTYNKNTLCKQIKILHKSGYDPNSLTLPFEMAKSRFIDGDYELIQVSGSTSIHAKDNLYNAVDENKQLVYCLEKENLNGIEMIGIVHLIEHGKN